MTGYGMSLFPHHQELLRASAVTPEVARARGYVSVDTKARLATVGFAEVQCRVPGLLIPIYDSSGQPALHQYRPDDPRTVDGKAVKYETPAGARLVLDVPRDILADLRRPRTPLVITEGSRKVDALLSKGLSAIGLLGVSAWRSAGVPLADMLDITWQDRPTIIAFDSDVMTKPSVRRELVALTNYLSGKGAKVQWVTLPHNPQEPQKVGVDDWLAQGHSAAELLALAHPPDIDAPPIPILGPRQAPDFPVDALPEPVSTMVDRLALFTQTDPGMAGTTALSALAAAAGGRVEIEVRPGWREPLCLFTATVAGPGERKSAVQSVMTAPLAQAESELAETGAAARREAETLQQVAAKATETAKTAAGRADGSTRESLAAEAIAAADQAASIIVPPVPRLLADDVTPEAAATLLAEQGGRLAVVSAEGGIFDVIAGRYSGNVPSMDVFLKGHAGDQLRVDRKGRPTEFIQRPALTMALMLQPSVLEAIARVDAFRGRGLLARFLYSVPPSRVGSRLVGAASVPPEVADAYATALRHLALELADWHDPAILQLTPDAADAMLDLERHVEPLLAPEAPLGHMADWGGKFVGAVARIAGLIHLGAHPEDGWRRPVSKETVEHARRLGDYYLGHALIAFDVMQADPAKADATILLAVIRRLGRELVTHRDLFAAVSRSRFPKSDALQPGLRVLEDHGWIAALPQPRREGAGRPPSPTYAVHRSALAPAGGEQAEPSNSADTADSAVPLTGAA